MSGRNSVCDGFAAALKAYGTPEQVLTDNGKVFTGKYNHPPVEVLFDRICRLNGVEHLLTQPRSPTTTGKIERFHRTLRVEFDTRQGRNYSGSACDVLVSDKLLQFSVGNELLKTVARTSTGEIRNKHAGGTAKKNANGPRVDTSTGGLT